MKTLISWTIANTRIKHLVWTALLFIAYLLIWYLPEASQGISNTDAHLAVAAALCLASIIWGYFTDTGIGSGLVSYIALIIAIVYALNNFISPDTLKSGVMEWTILSLIFGGIIGIIDCIYTAININDVISKRMRWKESRVGLLGSNVRYCIDRLFASASCASVWFICAFLIFNTKIS